jgi:hypothetical protein
MSIVSPPRMLEPIVNVNVGGYACSAVCVAVSTVYLC